MKVEIERDSFLNSLNIAMKGMSSRSTLPILSGIYMKAEDSFLTLQSTDLEISVKSEVDATIHDEGETVISGKLLFDIIKSLPPAAISLELEGSQLVVSCLESNFRLNTMNPEDFPSFPQLQTLQSVSLPANQLMRMVKKVSKAVSRDESRAILTGIFLKVENKKMTMVSTDSYRLAVVETELDNSQPLGIEMIIPGSSLDEISRLVSGDEIVEISEAVNQIAFTFGRNIFITRKIEGNYPNYQQLIPKEHTIKVTIETEPLISAIKRVSLLSQDHSPIRFTFSSEDNLLTISSSSQDLGGAEERIPVTIEGEDLEIGFNHQYIIDGLNAVDTEEFIFEARDGQKPGILTTPDNDGFLYLTMPVRLDR